jgi:heme exporter protein C
MRCSTTWSRTESPLLYAKRLRALSLLTAVTLTAGFGLAFFYAPMDADQGFMQKIFYVHVPLAIVALCGFVFGGIMAVQHLRTGDARYDLRSYVAIHLSLVLGAGVLITGSIWAKASWGHWWVWDEPTLVSFLIVFLLFATYQPLRFSIEDPERQARYASVFAITAGAFVPLNFIAVRMATAYTHPRVLSETGGQMPGEMRLTFIVALIAMALLFTTLWRLELAGKAAAARLRHLRRQLERPAHAGVRSTPPQAPPVAAIPARSSPR